jgi:hypothetical protein
MLWSSAIKSQRDALRGWATISSHGRYVSEVEESNPERWLN